MQNISSEDLQSLKSLARSTAENAYAPYSKFPVGAALLTQDGRTFVGFNVENSSYGLTNCAERSAIFSAIAAGVQPGDIRALLIYTPTNEPSSPCGACRQVLSDFLDPESLIYSICDSASERVWTMAALLPDSFDLERARSSS